MEFRKLAFTGIQVLDPQALRFIPKGTFSSIIHAYCEMIQTGLTLKGFVAEKHYWHDIGSIEGYREATRDGLVRKTFGKLFPEAGLDAPVWFPLQGDGSDRTWYRVTRENHSLIVVDHGPPAASGVCEADSFARIGQHLQNRGIPVPRIFEYHRPSGLIALEDLGDLNVQRLVQRTADPEAVLDHYQKIIDLLITLSLKGAKGFEPEFTFQTPRYDRELILERESRYFVEAFLNDYLGLTVDFHALESEFEILAKKALEHPYMGLLHRDFQSRNILVKDQNYYFIDFQGARFGPLPYDLASLLIDPYVQLSQSLQERLVKHAMEKLSERMPVDKDEFLNAYKYCAINRNLQILGAFAFLSKVKGKKDFEAYIPPALASLKQRFLNIEEDACKQVRRIVEGL
ncbi:MAG: phosphotransferase [Deltaproteobacteria bacterium]|nr:phosphotransferase [Deltaproteobacteria bacterium]